MARVKCLCLTSPDTTHCPHKQAGWQSGNRAMHCFFVWHERERLRDGHSMWVWHTKRALGRSVAGSPKLPSRLSACAPDVDAAASIPSPSTSSAVCPSKPGDRGLLFNFSSLQSSAAVPSPGLGSTCISAADCPASVLSSLLLFFPVSK
jgi:hypothetical protein